MIVTTDKNNVVQYWNTELDGLEQRDTDGSYIVDGITVISPLSVQHVYKVDGFPADIHAQLYTYLRDEGFKKYAGNVWGLPEETVQAIKEEAIVEVQEGAKNGKL